MFTASMASLPSACPVTRESTGNIERISREVRATIKPSSQKLPQLAGMKFDVFFDQGKEVARRHLTISRRPASGAARLRRGIIIFFFLRTARMTAHPHPLDSRSRCSAPSSSSSSWAGRSTWRR